MFCVGRKLWPACVGFSKAVILSLLAQKKTGWVGWPVQDPSKKNKCSNSANALKNFWMVNS